MLGEGAEEVAPEQAVVDYGEKHLKLLEPEVIVYRALTFQEASECLNTLGKDESGLRYAYLNITATDRKLTDVKTILNFKHLLFVDVSRNFLRLDDLNVLSEMPFLILLKAASNRSESAALNAMPYLQVLSLSRNRITETCDIDQPLLMCIDLNYNQIYTAQFDVDRLPSVKQLELRGNHLFDLSGVFPTTLESLYLAENKIAKLVSPDLAKLRHLKVLHLRDNHIRKLNGFTADLVNLKYLNVRQNRINKFRQFGKLQCLPNLEVLVVLQNPVAGDVDGKPGEGGGDGDDDEVEGEDQPEDVTRIPILALLPHLKRINKSTITVEDREQMYEVRDEKLAEIMGEESSDDDDDETAATTTELATDYTTDVDDEEEEEDETGAETNED